MEIKGRRYDNGEPVSIVIEGERIASIEPAWPTGDVDDWPFVAPGMFDLQINGYGGTWFSSDKLTADAVIETLEPHFSYGITRLCPTLVTNSFEALAAGFQAIDEACRREAWVEKMVPGCHLEGPFISREDGPRGAHPLEHVRPADWDEFLKLQEISGNRIQLVTLAAESEGACEFIRKAVASGVVVAIGHTGASPEQITAAVDAGARLSTHLGNGAHGTIRRHPNYIWEQLGDRRLWASIITDGHHLPGSVVRSIIGTKSTYRTIITCDAAGLAGCPPGVYDEGTMKVEILGDGRIVIAGQQQLLAGSSLETDTCVSNAMQMGGVSLSEAVDMAGRNPARLLGFEEIRLHRGSRADLMLFHYAGAGSKLEFVATLAAGAVRFGEIPSL
ncbi:MAG: amidohydrolase family protein [Planctomycetaceae bacterium]|jgi:N-acetylglucosamine-6-phosphate deacetylase|nr:amidohydrolase family protein [Planctomycetaceae bacterium]MBT6153553.1 amidohydrolase family protein [Planctomycetaceae bacterium]MBT6483066.1 amidohydrolase family protein [Planctomycetaceae bacterium]MBT6495385.1 amidohydrolase family protein [Planctomycetaceae bacterium]